MKKHEITTGFGVVESLLELTAAELTAVHGGFTTVPEMAPSGSKIAAVNKLYDTELASVGKVMDPYEGLDTDLLKQGFDLLKLAM
jgi:hypothetical protein